MKSSKQETVVQNPMQKIRLEKVVLSCGATGTDLEKSKKLLEMLSERKAQVMRSGPKQRIPDFGVKPDMELGVRITLRGKSAADILRRLLGAVENTLSKKQVSENTFSFGIKEYIEIPGTEYQRDIGIRGLNVTVTFMRPGARVKRKKIKAGHLPRKHHVSKSDIIIYMEENYKTTFE